MQQTTKTCSQARSVLFRRQIYLYKEFAKISGQPKQDWRFQTYNFDRSKAMKAVWAEKKSSGIMSKGFNRSIVQRRDSNPTPFKNLLIPMQKRKVIEIAREFEVDIKGLTIKIQRDERLLSTLLYGSTGLKILEE